MKILIIATIAILLTAGSLSADQCSYVTTPVLNEYNVRPQLIRITGTTDIIIYGIHQPTDGSRTARVFYDLTNATRLNRNALIFYQLTNGRWFNPEHGYLCR